MTDQYVTHRGHLYWYHVESVDYIAINDSFMLEGAIYFLLKKYFRKDPRSVNLKAFHNVSTHLVLGLVFGERG